MDDDVTPKKESIRPADDHYPTPPEVTRALMSVETFGEWIWEPFAGSGEMADELEDAGYNVFATTLNEGRPAPARDEGALCSFALYETWSIYGGVDFFLEPSERIIGDSTMRFDIVTNPPYKLAEEAVRHALKHNICKCAMLLNLKFLGSRTRKNGLFAEFPPARIWVFCDRPTMYPAGYTGKRNSTTETFAWYIWESPFHKRPPVVGWLDSREFME